MRLRPIARKKLRFLRKHAVNMLLLSVKVRDVLDHIDWLQNELTEEERTFAKFIKEIHDSSSEKKIMDRCREFAKVLKKERKERKERQGV